MRPPLPFHPKPSHPLHCLPPLIRVLRSTPFARSQLPLWTPIPRNNKNAPTGRCDRSVK
jgi:hypothetical protein